MYSIQISNTNNSETTPTTTTTAYFRECLYKKNNLEQCTYLNRNYIKFSTQEYTKVTLNYLDV